MNYTLSIGEKLKHFSIKKLLGAGGMGEVYLAHDESLSRDVAIKILKIPEGQETDNIEAIQRFLSEAKVLAQLSSESITTIHYISKAEERIPFIVMEYLEGESLKEYSGHTKLNLGFVLNCLSQISNGMQEVHSKGIIHRDIKPANLFFTKQEKFKILDFGIAKWENDSLAVETRTNQFVGSLMYAAPEVFATNKYDHRVDIYSLGISMISLLVGRSPYEGTTTYQLLNQIQFKDVRISPEIAEKLPEELLSLLYEMIEKDPNDRPATMEEVHQRINKIIQQNHNNMEMSIAKMLEVGEIDINLEDTFELRELVKQKGQVTKTHTTVKQLRPNPKLKTKTRPKINVKERPKSNSLKLVASIAFASLLAVAGWFLSHRGKKIEMTDTHTETPIESGKVEDHSNNTDFKRVGDHPMFNNTYRLINNLPAGADKIRLQSSFTELEKLSDRVFEAKKNDPDLNWHLMQMNRKMTRIEGYLKANSLVEARDEIINLQGILARRNRLEPLKRIPAREGQGDR